MLVLGRAVLVLERTVLVLERAVLILERAVLVPERPALNGSGTRTPRAERLWQRYTRTRSQQ